MERGNSLSGDVLEKAYDPAKVEHKWYQRWQEGGAFKPASCGNGQSYCIVIPPPNVTGSLHMGHALNNTLQDILIRYKRMQGLRTLWQCGTDHAGIATQNVVERQLTSENISRFDLGREAFIKRVWQWKEQYGGIIVQQLKKLGASCDWSRERFTMDEGCSRAVRDFFVSLYEEGLIYRGNRLINWCPRCHTALSDLETEHETIAGNLYHIVYPAADGSGGLTVATTRPETMLGDTAVAVNPQDARYQGRVNAAVVLPLMERRIPVIADEYVDLEFGTGALKVTPAHDPNDFELGKKYGLDLIKVIGEDGRMTAAAGPYAGLDRFEARARIVADLEAAGLLSRVEPYSHAVGHCYRCKTIIEPNLSLQWFVKVKPLAEPAIKAVQDGRTRIIPSSWEKTYFEWMRNIQDWCISRQIWWGHRIPAWYCGQCGAIVVARIDPAACTTCGGPLEQETDVLDTWFSSALWPFSTLGWPERSPELAAFYPTACLVTGFDILFFWVARMLMMGLKFMGDVPFRDVYIHALVRDSQGQKMSKSKGNVIDPLEVIDRFGTDSFRFTLTAMAAQGRDVRLSEDRIEGYRHFVNKIWNACRFVQMNMDGYQDGRPGRAARDLKDRWIISRLNRLIGQTTQALEEYRFNDFANGLYQFIWHEYCDWYLEMAKPDLYQQQDGQRRRATQQVMARVLRTAMELLHPVMPFVTEEIWQTMPHEGQSIVNAAFPVAAQDEIDPQAEAAMEIVIQVVTALRNMRSELNVPPASRPHADVLCHDEAVRAMLRQHLLVICALAGLASADVHARFERPQASAAAVVEKAEVFLGLAGILNIAEEKRRLQKELDKLDKDKVFFEKKLADQKFLQNAPPEIVDKERQKQAGLLEKQEKLRRNLTIITQMDGASIR